MPGTEAPLRRTTFKILGGGCVALGIAGAFLPLLPTTIFFVLAAACFARSSPALEKRILDHPVFGPQVIAWRDHGAIPRKAKLMAFAGMAGGFLVFYLTAAPNLWLTIGVAVFFIACAAYVGTRPAGPKHIHPDPEKDNIPLKAADKN